MKLNHALLMIAVATPAALAADAAARKAEPSVFDRVWSYADLYKNEENDVLQRLQFTGRFQLDYAVVDATQGDTDELNIRRLRAGFKAKMFRDVTIHAEGDFNPQEPEPLYVRLTDAYVAWSRDKSLTVTLGKQSAPFTMDGTTSSKELLAIDRSNLSNNLWFPNEYFPGASVSGQVEQWRYLAGVFTSGGANREFGEFTGGQFALAKLGYDFSKTLGSKQALLSLDYVFNNPDADNTWTRNLHHVASLNFSYATEKWGARADISEGEGYRGQSDLWGAMLMPFYNVTDQLQIVTRFTHVESERNNGVRLALYESQVVPQRGDEYNEVYLGLNYYLYGHKLKVQTGVQYAEMDDDANDRGKYSGWAWVTGLRVAW